MSILFLSVVISTTCAVSTPAIDDRTITQAISMVTKELVSRHDSVQCWEEELAGGWLSKHEGNWAFESSGFNRWKCTPMTLERAEGKPLIVVGGIDDVDATDQLASDVIRAASMGSTVLIETIGGQGNFTMKLRSRISSKASVILEPIKSIPPLQGRRGWTIHHNQIIDPPLIAQIDRGSIVFVACDIRNALLGQPSWGIHGYDQKSAQHLITYLMNQRN